MCLFFTKNYCYQPLKYMDCCGTLSRYNSVLDRDNPNKQSKKAIETGSRIWIRNTRIFKNDVPGQEGASLHRYFLFLSIFCCTHYGTCSTQPIRCKHEPCFVIKKTILGFNLCHRFSQDQVFYPSIQILLQIHI